MVSRFYRFSLKARWESTSDALVTVGFILPVVAQNMPWTAKFHVDHQERLVTIKYADGRDVETTALRELLEKARELDAFEVLRGWRNELYPVLGLGRDVHMERAGSALFGIHTTGVHVTGLCRTAQGALRLWVPRRAATKQTYGGMLDNTVAGGIAAGEDPFESMVREAGEEASLPEALVRERVRSVGTISYVHARDHRAGGETGLLQPETQYVYDLELPEDVTPKPSDNEVHEFYLWDVEQVLSALKEGQFKPNCAVCLIDFLVRHGVITASNEPDYLDIIARMHRRIHF